MRRREFLGKTLIGSAGMALGASGLLTASCKGANDKVVLAIIGLKKIYFAPSMPIQKRC